ncbi:MAG TPA: hypothetical protein VFE33_00755 [Thermoanaerobaculia bacterium]|nr:hypothetical protein [Thermoanaerobaculia bacterium]
MPGGSSRYRFVGKTPWPVRLVVIAAGLNLVASSVLRSWASHTAVPDAVHSYALYSHRSATYYAPLAGRYFAGGFLLVHLLCMVVIALLYHVYRDQLQYVPPRPTAPHVSPAPSPSSSSLSWESAARSAPSPTRGTRPSPAGCAGGWGWRFRWGRSCSWAGL